MGRGDDRCLLLIVAQLVQHCGQPIIVDVPSCYRLSQTVPQRLQSSLHLRLHMVHPMIPFREYMGQPDRCHPSQAQPLPVAVCRKMLIQQRYSPQAVHVSEQQRDSIDSFYGDGHCFFHTVSLPESLYRIQIYSNHKWIRIRCNILKYSGTTR